MRCALVYCLVVDLTISVLLSVGVLFHDVELDVGGPTELRQTCFCAGSLGGAPNHTYFTNSKTKFLFKDIEVLYTTSFTATSILMLHMYSQTAVRLRLTRSLRSCCSKP